MIWKAFLVTYIVSSSISFSSVLLVAVELAEELLPSRWFTSSSPARSISRSPSESSCCRKNRSFLIWKHSVAPGCIPKSYEQTLSVPSVSITQHIKGWEQTQVRFFSCNLETFFVVGSFSSVLEHLSGVTSHSALKCVIPYFHSKDNKPHLQFTSFYRDLQFPVSIAALSKKATHINRGRNRELLH